MSKVYILNTYIEFSPEKCQLTARNTDNLVITLNKPVSRCLELLIERRYSIVPQRDFYPYVWGSEGDSVSVMMLYQCISLLRKALKAFKDAGGDKMVNTVPKNGFVLDPSVIVQEEIEGVPVISTNDLIIESETVISESGVFPSMPKKPGLKRGYVEIILVLLGIFLLVMSVYQFTLRISAKTDRYLGQFDEIGLVSACHVYIYGEVLGVEPLTSIIKDNDIDCKESPYVYVTHFQFSQQYSLLSCDTALSGAVAPTCTAIHVTWNDK
ncbi:TPA: winged helix-turn-helix domain-containing protein [Serratia fonticola]|nr:winged helix-turn-helix domain-containing protein [Serratia fonticola]